MTNMHAFTVEHIPIATTHILIPCGASTMKAFPTRNTLSSSPVDTVLYGIFL